MRHEVYSEILINHHRHPVGNRRPEKVNRRAQGRNRVCGDEVRLYLWIDADGLIKDAGFDGKGCMISQASASMMCKALKNKTRDEAIELIRHIEKILEEGPEAAPDTADYRALGQIRQYPARIPCALLAWDTLHKALRDNVEEPG